MIIILFILLISVIVFTKLFIKDSCIHFIVFIVTPRRLCHYDSYVSPFLVWAVENVGRHTCAKAQEEPLAIGSASKAFPLLHETQTQAVRDLSSELQKPYILYTSSL